MKSIIEIILVVYFYSIVIVKCINNDNMSNKNRFKSISSTLNLNLNQNSNSITNSNKFHTKFRSRTKSNSNSNIELKYDGISSNKALNNDFNYFIDDNNSEVLSYLMKKENDISDIGSLGNWGNIPKLSDFISGLKKSNNQNKDNEEIWSKDLHCDCIKLKNVTDDTCKCKNDNPDKPNNISNIVCDPNSKFSCNKTKITDDIPECNKTTKNDTIINKIPINITVNIEKNISNPSLEIPKLNKIYNQTINVNISTFNKPFELSYEKLFNMTKNALKGLLQKMPLNITVNLNKNIRGNQSPNINFVPQTINPRPCLCPKIKLPECKAVCPQLVIPKNNDTDKILDKLKYIENNINDLRNKYENIPLQPPSQPSSEDENEVEDEDDENDIQEESPNNDKIKKFLLNGILESEKSKNSLIKYLLLRKIQNKKNEAKNESSNEIVKEKKEEERQYVTYHRPQPTQNRVISTYSVINGLYYTPVKPNIVIAKQVPCPSCSVRQNINLKNAVTPIIIGE